MLPIRLAAISAILMIATACGGYSSSIPFHRHRRHQPRPRRAFRRRP